MCKHILNAKCFVQAPCCKRWFECSECHDEVSTHPFQFIQRLRFTCKECRRCFPRDFGIFSESDKLCDHCKARWVVTGVTPESKIFEEANIVLDSFMADILNADQKIFSIFQAK